MSEKKKRGLGKNLSEMGLSALLGDNWQAQNHNLPPSSTSSTPHTSDTQHDQLQQIAIDQLQPGYYQPRRNMQDENLQELAMSIQQQGIVQPLIVRPIAATGDGTNNAPAYEIVAGERRWRAAQIAELTEVPVVIRELDNRSTLAIALIENLQREDLNAIDQAIALQQMLNEFDLSHAQLAEAVSKSRASVSNLLRLLNLHPELQKFIQQGDLDMGHGRALLAVPTDEQPALAELIISRSLTVRQVEKLLQQRNQPKKDEDISYSADAKLQLERMQKRLSQRLNCKVLLQAKNNKRGNGKLVIHYNDKHHLEDMLQHLLPETSGDD